MKSLLHACICAFLAQLPLSMAAQADEIIFGNSFETCFPGKLFDWDGGGDGITWAEAANWNGDALPHDGDSISVLLLNQPAIIYDGSLQTTIIRCFDSSLALTVTGGALEITESATINAPLTITGGTLKVSGNLHVRNTPGS